MSAPVKETIAWVTDGSLPDSDESVQVMLKAAQEAAAQASGLILADAIAKACR